MIVNQQLISVPASVLAKMLAISERHVRKLNAEGKLPRPINLGRCVRWNVAELHRWQAAGAPNRELWEDMQSSDSNQSLNDRRDTRYS